MFSGFKFILHPRFLIWMLDRIALVGQSSSKIIISQGFIQMDEQWVARESSFEVFIHHSDTTMKSKDRQNTLEIIEQHESRREHHHFQSQTEHAVHLSPFPRLLSTSQIYFWVQPLQPKMTQDTHFSDLEGLPMGFGDQSETHEPDIIPLIHTTGNDTRNTKINRCIHWWLRPPWPPLSFCSRSLWREHDFSITLTQ